MHHSPPDAKRRKAMPAAATEPEPDVDRETDAASPAAAMPAAAELRELAQDPNQYMKHAAGCIRAVEGKVSRLLKQISTNRSGLF